MSENDDRRHDKWFNKQAIVSALIPSVISLTIMFVGMKQQLALMDQKLEVFEDKLKEVKSDSIGRIEFNNLAAIVKANGSDVYHTSDAKRDFQFRDFRIDKLESKAEMMETYLFILNPNWKKKVKED